MITKTQRRALSVIGSIGGRKSKRTLTNAEASRIGKLGAKARAAKGGKARAAKAKGWRTFPMGAAASERAGIRDVQPRSQNSTPDYAERQPQQ